MMKRTSIDSAQFEPTPPTREGAHLLVTRSRFASASEDVAEVESNTIRSRRRPDRPAPASDRRR